MVPGAGDEPVEEVGPDGEVLRIVTRAEMRRHGLRHRAVAVAVVDPAGTRVLAHRRAAWKDVWPSRWDLAFGGVVAPGEPWVEAARRELREEAGIEVAASDLAEIGAGTYDDGTVSEVARVFLARSEGPFRFDDGEVVAVEWVGLDGLGSWVGAHELCPDGVALVLPLLDGQGPVRGPAGA